MIVVPTALRHSPIHGLGVFSLQPIDKGQTISRFLPPFDVQYTADILPMLTPAERRYLRNFAYRSRFTGVYILTGDHDRYMNHSEDPNVGMSPDGLPFCVALRFIAIDEELVCDYRTFDADWREKLEGPCVS